MGKKKLIIYLAVLGIAVTTFLVDRFVIRSPQAAQAALVLEGSIQDLVAAPQSVQPDGTTQDEVPFPKKLGDLRVQGLSRVPFALPFDLAMRRDRRLATRVSEPDVLQVRRPGEPLRVADFIQTHQLNGVIVGDVEIAIVDGRMVEVGQAFDASKLLRIEGQTAHFQCLDGVAELSLVTSRQSVRRRRSSRQ